MIIEEFNDLILDLLKRIGFSRGDDHHTAIGVSEEYRYYPDYLGTNQYTMVIFRYRKDQDSNYRLYIHNQEGKFVSSPFQLRAYNEYNQNLIKGKIEEIFCRELREIKLEKILNEI